MIEFKEGAVCYADGECWYESGDFSLVAHFSDGCGDPYSYDSLFDYPDFQLNEPREGWYIPKSELDTEEKYNQAVEVFGLFGFELNKYHKGYSELIKVWRGVEVYRGELASTNATDGVKCTFSQLMAIGELKRKVDEPKFGKDEDGSMKLLKGNFSEIPNSSEQVKNPSHYQLMDGIESIEIIARSMTKEQWKGFCLGNMLKYRIRAGKKDKLQQDIDKANFYGELYEMHKGKCYE